MPHWINNNLLICCWCHGQWWSGEAKNQDISSQWCWPHLPGIIIWTLYHWVNTLRPRQNGRHFADDMFKCIFLNVNVWIPIEISLTLVPKGSINNNPALFQIMAWRRPGDKPLSEPMMVSSLMHICVTRPQWVNTLCVEQNSICVLWKKGNSSFGRDIWITLADNDEQWVLKLRRRFASLVAHQAKAILYIDLRIYNYILQWRLFIKENQIVYSSEWVAGSRKKHKIAQWNFDIV